jgi:hypothetical protein
VFIPTVPVWPNIELVFRVVAFAVAKNSVEALIVVTFKVAAFIVVTFARAETKLGVVSVFENHTFPWTVSAFPNGKVPIPIPDVAKMVDAFIVAAFA